MSRVGIKSFFGNIGKYICPTNQESKTYKCVDSFWGKVEYKDISSMIKQLIDSISKKLQLRILLLCVSNYAGQNCP